MKKLCYAVLSAIISLSFIYCSISLAQCDTHHVWTEIEIVDQPCVRTYRTIYPSDYLCCGVFGVSVCNFHCWEYDITHVNAIPQFQPCTLPKYPGEEADRVPELKEACEYETK